MLSNMQRAQGQAPASGGVLLFNPNGTIKCLFCRRALFFEAINESDPPISLDCQPAFHVFCSSACLMRFLEHLQSRGVLREGQVQCPACGVWISPELMENALSRWKRSPIIESKAKKQSKLIESKRAPMETQNECGECKQVKPVTTYSCDHSLCATCKVTLTEKLKTEKYEPKPEHDPNCLLCRKPDSWFNKAKTFATSDTGMSAIKSAGEYGYRYCCSDCTVF